MEQFAPYEIKTDPDLGLSYFVDGWGNPIYLLALGAGLRIRRCNLTVGDDPTAARSVRSD